MQPNYGTETLTKLSELYASSGLENPSVIVDTNHCNSGKDALKQPQIALEVINSVHRNADIRKLLKGLMIESYLKDGCQSSDGSTYGRSITDPCLGWEKTEKLILDLAEKW